MKNVDEIRVAQEVDRYVRGAFGAALQPYFQGYVAAVNRKTAGSGASLYTSRYVVTVRKLTDLVADGRVYATITDYVPVVGDLVECVRRDEKTGYVLGSLVPQRNRLRARAHSNANQGPIVAATFTKVTLQVEDYDGDNDFDPSTSTWTCRVPGLYTVAGIVSDASAVTARRLLALIYKNGVEVQRAGQVIPTLAAGSPLNVPVVDEVPFDIGETCNLYAWSTIGDTLSGTYPGDACVLSVAFRSGL